MTGGIYPRQVVLTTASGKSEQRNSKMENCLPITNQTSEKAVKKPHSYERGFYHLLAKDYLLVETCTPGPIVELMVMLFK